jgi:hypothetical protein
MKHFIVLGLSGALVMLLGGVLISDAATGDMVQNLTSTPHNGAAALSWDQVTDNSGAPATSYEISYGLYSVAEGLADVYDNAVTTENAETTYVLRNLTNGVRYYITAKAVFADGSKSSVYAPEVVVTPSSVYSAAPAEGSTVTGSDCGTDDGAAPVVQEAKALTQNLVKVTFSECVTLPDILPELSFLVAESENDTATIAVEKAEYKVDYKGEGAKEDTHKDIIFVTLAENSTVGTEYTVTVSASVVDEQGNPIESGVTDSATFTGTDATEIPEDEKPLVSAPLGSEVPAETTTETVPEVTPETTPEEDLKGAPGDPVPDTTAPDNVTNFDITYAARAADYLLSFKWVKSISPDVVGQKFYQSMDKGTSWAQPVALGKDVETYEASGQPETEYTYKITASDAAGNENSGTIESVRLPALASTGAPLALIAFGVSFAFNGVRRLSKKK